jgi:hypothetical protein
MAAFHLSEMAPPRATFPKFEQAFKTSTTSSARRPAARRSSTTQSRRRGSFFSSTSTHWRERKRSRPGSTEKNTASFSTSSIGGRAGPRRGSPMVRARRPRRTGPRSTRGQPGLRGAQPTLATSSSARVDEPRRYKVQVALDLRRRPAHFCSSSLLMRMNPLRRAGRYQSNTKALNRKAHLDSYTLARYRQ